MPKKRKHNLKCVRCGHNWLSNMIHPSSCPNCGIKKYYDRNILTPTERSQILKDYYKTHKHWAKGRKQTPEHIQHVKDSHKKANIDYSFTQTPEYKEKMRIALSGSKNPRWGIHLSEDLKRKISESEKGKKVVVTEQHRKNMVKAGKRSFRLRNPLLYKIRNCLKYREWRAEVLKDAFPDGMPEGLEEIHVHHRVGLFQLIKQYNITTLEEALECSALWDKKNALVLTKSEHYIISVLERRREPSKGLIFLLREWLSKGKFKVVPIGEMIGSPYEDKFSYKELIPSEAC